MLVAVEHHDGASTSLWPVSSHLALDDLGVRRMRPIRLHCVGTFEEDWDRRGGGLAALAAHRPGVGDVHLFQERMWAGRADA